MKNPYAPTPTTDRHDSSPYHRYPLAPASASASQPPAYRSDNDDDDGGYGGPGYVEQLYDESQDFDDSQVRDHQGGLRVVGPEDSPSCYSDNYEYQSTISGGGLGRQGTQRSQANGNGNGNRGSQFLQRNGTLLPGDSVSEYNVPAPSKRAHEPMPAMPQSYQYPHHHQYDDSRGAGDPSSDGHGYDGRDYYAYDDPREGEYKTIYGGGGGGGGNGTAAAPYPEAEYYDYRSAAPATQPHHGHGHTMSKQTDTGFDMVYGDRDGYADDDDDYYHDKARGHSHEQQHAYPPPPGLFANDLARAGGDAPSSNPKSHFSFAPADGMASHPDGGKNFLDHGDEDDSVGGKARRMFGVGDGGLSEQIERRRRGLGRQRWPVVTWIFAVAFVAVFVAEIVKAKNVTGQAVQTKPYLNPMIGPSAQFLITMGARYVPCMRSTPAVPLTTLFQCLNSSSSSSTCTTPLWEICGLPNDHTYGQSYRFVTPIFLHAGVVHILFNLVVQLTLCAQIERILGSPYYLLVYLAGGLGGNLLGGNFGLVATPSVGASGAIYGCIAVELVDLAYNWRFEYRAKTRLTMSILFTLIGLALGLLPGLDNFAHIGGLAVGLLGGMVFAPSIHQTRTHRNVVWGLRVLGVVALAAFFAALALNFYRSDDPTKACTWCRYLSCLPSFKQCQNGGLQVSNSTSSTRRAWMG
ncbi:rhomboid-domain-containing protein [Jaminaea rosea]|uniref:Rhomboid-type serine protease n=1 Tax=Jaminaea rosea TaxID=1569628 RepID=A0A316UGL5_9BASI|nr:rhomboid-domain-containing protein [Jaminaea rosea]PWN24379.1 rhomboid-domain-containing protein [Jaminaea rosea]